MKYGKTERVSGIVILLALLAIMVPWLMSDPAPREERPQPTFVIEQPVQAIQRDVPAPQMPASIANTLPTETSQAAERVEPVEEPEPQAPETAEVASPTEPSVDTQAPVDHPVPDADPIAALMASSASGNRGQEALSPAVNQQGEWAVQVGSFGDAANARRLSEQLSDEGFTTYQRERDNRLTTVYVGPYATSEDGEAATKLIKQRVNVQGLLVRIRD